MNELIRLPLSREFRNIAENVYFVLVEPEVHGNIGATARALKTCGFKKMILVNPADKNHREARWLAHQSEDILEGAQVVTSFQEAVSDKRLVIGTTQRKRHFRFPFYTPEEISEKIEEVAQSHTVAIVFGRERTGLTNEELTSCHLHSTIQTATSIPALNLSHAVMIYAYTFYRLQNIKGKKYRYDLASQKELNIFYEHLQQSLKNVNFVPRDTMDDFVTRFKRLLGRAMAEKRDVRLLHKLLQIFETRIQELEKQNHDENQKPVIY